MYNIPEIDSYEEAIKLLKKVEKRRREVDEYSDKLKKIEKELKQSILNTMNAEAIEMVRTSEGTITKKIIKTVRTQLSEQFKNWLRCDIITNYNKWRKNVKCDDPELYIKSCPNDCADLLLASPYSKPKITEYAEDGDLPPGLIWYREQRISITKK